MYCYFFIVKWQSRATMKQHETNRVMRVKLQNGNIFHPATTLIHQKIRQNLMSRLVIHSFTHALSHSRTRSLTHSLAHSHTFVNQSINNSED